VLKIEIRTRLDCCLYVIFLHKHLSKTKIFCIRICTKRQLLFLFSTFIWCVQQILFFLILLKIIHNRNRHIISLSQQLSALEFSDVLNFGHNFVFIIFNLHLKRCFKFYQRNLLATFFYLSVLSSAFY
jgi:hypothetical protein